MYPGNREEDELILSCIVVEDVIAEYERATKKFGKFHTAHEGYAVLLEEVDELWEAVKLNKKKHPERNDLMMREATQVAAMAFRFLHDVCLEEE